jgi:hypothetical protein
VVSDSNVTWNSRVCAICDLDGDRRPEIVTTRWRRRQLCPDPFFYPSKTDSCVLTILDGSLKSRQELPLPLYCQGLTLGDIIPGGNIEMLVLTDRLTLYTMD